MIQLLPEIRMKVPNRHSIYGGVIVKAIHLFLLSSCPLLALFLPSSSSLPPLYTETLPKLRRTYPLPSPFLAPSYPLELRSNLLTLGIAQTSLALRSLTRNFVYDCGTDQIHAPFSHRSTTVQPPFNHHSCTIQPPFNPVPSYLLVDA